MNTTDKTRIDEHEWQAQERGMRAALEQDAGELDAAAMRYRIVAGALTSFPCSEPPADFAADVVNRIASHDAGIERLLSQILLVVFLIAAIIVGVQYGEQAWQALHPARHGDALAWVLAGMGCMALSWLCSRVFELAGHVPRPGRAAY